MENFNDRLHKEIAQVCPIDGVSIGNPADKSTWRIDFAKDASDQQREAALAAALAFDPSKPAPRRPTVETLTAALIAKGVLTAEDIGAVKE